MSASHPAITPHPVRAPGDQPDDRTPAALVRRPTTPSHIIVAFQGQPGAFAHRAIEQVWGAQARALSSWSFETVVDAVRSGVATHGIIPTTNITAGDVPGTRDLLQRAGIRLVDEVTLPVRHALLGIRGSSLAGIREAHSHPMAIRQCLGFLDRNHAVVPVEANDTAGAARELSLRPRGWRAAIAGAWCAERYGLVVLAHDIQDRPDNATRFAIIARAEHRRSAVTDSSGSRLVVGKAVGL